MKRIYISDAAKRDRLEIWLHIAADNAEAANRLLDEFDEKIFLIAESPNLGRSRDDISAGIRSFPVGNYLILYVPESRGITIVRILHGSRRLQDLI